MNLFSSKQLKYSFLPCQSSLKKGIVVFCHGFGVTSGYFNSIGEWLSQDYDYYAVELPGMGITPCVNPKELSVMYYAECLRDWLLEMQFDHIILMGHSMGGAIVEFTANLVPHLITKLVMICPMNSAFSWKLIHSFRISPTTPKASWKTAKLLYKYPERLFKLKAADPQLVVECNQQKKIKVYTKALFMSFLNFKTGKILKFNEKHLAVPTFLIVASDDQIIDAKATIKKLVKNCYVTPVTIKDSGHIPFLDQPEAFKQVLSKILSEPLS